MKKTIRLIMLVMAVCLFTPAMASAEKRQQQEERKTPEEIAEMQARHIASRMKLDEEKTAKLISVYCGIEKELREVESKNTRTNSSMTEEEVENVILARFERSQKILDIRRKGYAEYRQFLTPRQTEEVYKLEKQTKKRLAERKAQKHKSSDRSDKRERRPRRDSNRDRD